MSKAKRQGAGSQHLISPSALLRPRQNLPICVPPPPHTPRRAGAECAGPRLCLQCSAGVGPGPPCPAAPVHRSHHRKSPGQGAQPASGAWEEQGQAEAGKAHGSGAWGPGCHKSCPYLVDEGDRVHQELCVGASFLLQDGHQVGPGKSTWNTEKEAVTGDGQEGGALRQE